MKGVIAFAFFLLFLAGYALVSLRGGGAGSAESTETAASLGLPQTRWQVATVNGAAAAAETDVFIEFGEQNSLSGNGGCNFFSGTYELGADSFRVSALRATRKACGPDVMRVEQSLFDALGTARSLALEGKRLRLHNEAGSILIECEKIP